MSKILVTGGAGYVGAVLVPYLINKGHKITVIDLMIYGEEVLKFLHQRWRKTILIKIKLTQIF